jgi:hypothetical protein
MDADAGPCQAWPVRSEVSELNAFTAELNSLPIPSQAAAASNIGSEPGPSSSSTELTSGGDTEKFIPLLLDRPCSSPIAHGPETFSPILAQQNSTSASMGGLVVYPNAQFLLTCWSAGI